MEKFVCVNCGAAISMLYKKYNSDVLKLIQCEACGSIGDKYIEYDIVIILIDIILFKKEPYRHILCNTEFKNHWKIWVVIFLLKTYVVWVTAGASTNNLSNNVSEHGFYLSALVTAAGYTSFLLVVIMGLKMRKSSVAPIFDYNQLSIWKALVLSEFGQFLLIPSLVWKDVPRQLHYLVVTVYVVVSRIQALSVVTPLSRAALLILISLAIAAESCVTTLVGEYLHEIR